MSTTSQKHRNFIAEPMSDKPVTDLAGIGDVLGKRLSSKGFDKVNKNVWFHFIFFANFIRIFFLAKSRRVRFQCKQRLISHDFFSVALFSGIRRPWSVSCAQEEPRPLRRLAERLRRGELQTSRRLLPMLERLVWRILVEEEDHPRIYLQNFMLSNLINEHKIK